MAVHASGTEAVDLGPASVPTDKAVVLCFDHDYAFYASVALLSICLATASRDFNFAVICEGLEPEDISRLRSIAETFDRSITVISVAPDAHPELTGFGRWSRTTHFRALAPELLNAGTLLYIDADCLVHGDVAELFGQALLDAMVGGVADRDGTVRETTTGMLGLGDDPYINAGVLLIDAERWRAEGMTEAYKQCFPSNRDRIDWPNQDTMNILLKGRKRLIDGKWNTMMHEHGRFGLEARLGRRGIWHFTQFRPWQRWSDPWLRDVYLGFAEKLGLPPGYWVEPRIVSEWLMTAEAIELDGDLRRANLMYKGLLHGLVTRDPALLRRPIDQSPSTSQ